ncbi:ketosteroid isomerase-like protein [Sinobacterium caligoides]|uniref:Ketosteroid isomerase-like protein n=1 Tax=Sinobacterium caligoides TaxID=933926 RepID=A0A3N2DMT2_9GAMM|nr:nuclear transport factor 2 family protein [Sinobacterium caligoides]ROS00969.1 ketosteroid isomerase-like protein [Sinobacterium caligoides]
MSNAILAQQASQKSMQHVQAKDKSAWLSLFTHDAVVEDPVGKSPLDPSGEGQQGIEAIASFWDNIIAHGDIRLEIKHSIPAGDECANFVHIEKTMGDLHISNDMIVVYRANAAGKICSLKAYWEYAAVEQQIIEKMAEH